MLGWGTEFLDTELDGWPDLVVLNGHVEDRRRLGDPYRMRPQLFRNIGNAKFEKVDGAAVGPWFQEPRLARTLATLDWNRDGREDFAASNLDSPAALLICETRTWNSDPVHLKALSRRLPTISSRSCFSPRNRAL